MAKSFPEDQNGSVLVCLAQWLTPTALTQPKRAAEELPSFPTG